VKTKGLYVLSSKLTKNWLVLALVSVMSFTVATSAYAARRTHDNAPRVSKAKVVVKDKSALVVKARRLAGNGQVKARAGAARKIARARAADVEPRMLAHAKVFKMDSAMPSFTPVSVQSQIAMPRRSLSSIIAASGASGASFGQLFGLHQTQDPLDLRSSVALVIDQDTNEVVFAKNSEAVLPIASLTKLMTAVVMVEAHLSMDEFITVTSEDVDYEKNSSSRLAVGSTLTRGEALHLALMSSENRAAHALGRTYPGGLPAFVQAMNTKARSLGMADTRYVDPTGLNSGNQSSAKDLAALVKAAYQEPLIRELSTTPEHAVRVGARQLQFRNTNSLVRSPAWDIGLQKTGYIVEAGRCLVMQARMAGRKFILVFLDSNGKYSRQADAERVRKWIEKASQKGSLSGVSHIKVTS
jgi:D-alanyl-D-alanine endopeptidase (penicillin-binding protein 7)